MVYITVHIYKGEPCCSKLTGVTSQKITVRFRRSFLFTECEFIGTKSYFPWIPEKKAKSAVMQSDWCGYLLVILCMCSHVRLPRVLVMWIINGDRESQKSCRGRSWLERLIVIYHLSAGDISVICSVWHEKSFPGRLQKKLKSWIARYIS